MHPLTPCQTVGPFFELALCVQGPVRLGDVGTVGRRVTIAGTVRDGSRAPVPDAVLEIWQADAEGRFAHPDDEGAASGDASFCGFGRAATDDDGRFTIDTVIPGPVQFSGDAIQAPHLVLGVLARGLLTRLVTRLYFDDEPANATDPILALVPPERRTTLLAHRVADDQYRFDLVLQGERETVFFEV